MRLATEQDIPEIDALFCSEAEALKLQPHVCAESNRHSRLNGWLMPAVRTGLVWVTSTEGCLDGFMVMQDGEDSGGPGQ